MVHCGCCCRGGELVVAAARNIRLLLALKADGDFAHSWVLLQGRVYWDCLDTALHLFSSVLIMLRAFVR